MSQDETVRMDLSPGDVSVPAIQGPAAVAPPKGKRRKGKKVKLKSTLGVGGSLSVRYMKDSRGELAILGVIEMDASNSTTEDRSPKWIQLATTGKFKGHAAGPFELSMETFGQIIDNFKSSKNQRIPIDFNHASEQDPTSGSLPVIGAPACGWIVDMKVEGGNLWGLVQWGDLARQYIRDGGYRYFSPAIRFNSRDRVTGQPVGARMSSGALTNDPFLDAMMPVSANFDEIAKVVDLSAFIDELDDAFVDHTDDDTEATEEVALTHSPAATAALSDSSGRTALKQEDIDMATLEETTKLLANTQSQVSELTIQLNTMRAEMSTQLTATKSELELSRKSLAASEALVATLSAEKAKREDEDLSVEVDQAILTWGERKGIGPADKGHLLNFRKSSPEGFRAMFPHEDPAKTKLLARVVPKIGREDETRADAISDESLSETVKRLMSNDRTLSKTAATDLAFLERGTAASLSDRNLGRAAINGLPPAPVMRNARA